MTPLPTPAGCSARTLTRAPRLRTGVLALLGAMGMASAQAVTHSLSYDAYAQTYGYLNVQYSGAVLGSISFSMPGGSSYKSNYGGWGLPSTGVEDARPRMAPSASASTVQAETGYDTVAAIDEILRDAEDHV